MQFYPLWNRLIQGLRIEFSFDFNVFVFLLLLLFTENKLLIGFNFYLAIL